MQAGHDGNEAEAESIARTASTALEPVEPLENAQAILDGDPRSTIGHRHEGTPIVLADHDPDVAGVTVLDGIVDKIREGIEEEITITEHGDLSAALERHLAALFLGRGVEQLGDLARHVGQIYGPEHGGVERLDA